MFGSFKGKIVLSREKIMEIHLFLKYLPILYHHIVINVNFFFYNVKTKKSSLITVVLKQKK